MRIAALTANVFMLQKIVGYIYICTKSFTKEDQSLRYGCTELGQIEDDILGRGQEL